MSGKAVKDQPGNFKYKRPLPSGIIWVSCLLIGLVIFSAVFLYKRSDNSSASESAGSAKGNSGFWEAPDESEIPSGKAGEEIRYGKELLSHTSLYLGPKGSVTAISNGMNCQNCHLEAGRRSFGLNYAAVATVYPRFMARSGSVVSIADRINGCFERSMNGKKLDTSSREMKAMIAYMKWLGKEVSGRPDNSRLLKLKVLDYAADPFKGRLVFLKYCQTCHGSKGQGKLNADGTEYIYPPLWGEHSYNDGAGLYRLSNFSGFVKNNMPYGINYQHPMLSDEEAWNVAAYVNSQPRPHLDQSKDWKDIQTKPFDFPFGPYADHFTEDQHKYGPFGPVKNWYKRLKVKQN